MKTNSLKELVAVLGEKVLLLETVRDRLEEEQRCIIDVYPDALAKNTEAAEECISRLNSLNSRFRTLLSRTGDELGITEAESLSSIISAVEPETGIQLRDLQKRCFSVAGAIGVIIKMNQALLKNSLDIIGRSLSLFSTLLGGAETYGAAGRISNGKADAGIFCREI
jgi:hypothetical protein